MGKKGWKTRGGQLVSQANNATGVSSTGLSVLSPLHHLPLVSIFILSLVAPALRNVWEESLEDSSNLDGGASVQPRIGVIPICNRWIVASFSRFNDTRFGGIETGLLYLVDVQVYDERIEDTSFGIVVRWERRAKV